MDPATHPRHPYLQAEEQLTGSRRRHPVVICGAGPAGLTLAIGLARQAIPVVLLEKDDTFSMGSRAICWAERTLDIWGRLGCVQPILERSVTWDVGRVFYQNQEVYSFDLKPKNNHKSPPFRNLQQYEVEAILFQYSQELGNVNLRWKHQARAIRLEPHRAVLEVQTPDSAYELEAGYVIAADGAQSTIRQSLGLQFQGVMFETPFLIADIRMRAAFPSERLFWFDPSFHPGRSALLHKQANQLWRIDLQLEPGADPDEERKPDRIAPRIRALIGDNVPFDVVWSSVYTFKCRRLSSFRHGRVIFIGDAAHQLSPFGARGGNCAVQDAENLAWKLGLVLKGLAPEALIDSYDEERTFGADFDIMTAMRSNQFIAPQTHARRVFREAVLMLSKRRPFARPLVNSGRMSSPTILSSSLLSTPDSDQFSGDLFPGSPCPNVGIEPLEGGPTLWLHDGLGQGFSALYFTQGLEDIPTLELATLAAGPIPVTTRAVTASADARQWRLPPGVTALVDTSASLARLFDARPGTFYLLRPDLYVVARWRQFDARSVRQAMKRATGRSVKEYRAELEARHG